MTDTPKSLRIVFHFDEASLRSLEQLQAEGVTFDVIEVTAVDGTTKPLHLPRHRQPRHPQCPGCRCGAEQEAAP